MSYKNLESVLLTDTERTKVIEWLNFEASVHLGMAEQMKTLTMPLALIKREQYLFECYTSIFNHLNKAEKQTL